MPIPMSTPLNSLMIMLRIPLYSRSDSFVSHFGLLADVGYVFQAVHRNGKASIVVHDRCNVCIGPFEDGEMVHFDRAL